MAIDKIDKKLSNIPLLRKRITVNPTIQADKDDFMDKYETTNDHLSNKTVGELNQIVDAIDNTTTQIDTAVDTINTAAETATTKANEASESALSASESANVVLSNKTNIDAIGANISDINTVASNETNINAVASNETNINICAENITDIQNASSIVAGLINDSTSSSSSTYSSQKIDTDFYDKTETDNLLDNKQDTLVSGTNIKTINSLSILGSGNVDLLTKVNPIIEGSITEEVYNLVGTEINPANGTIQYKTLTTNVTFTESLINGQYVVLRIAGGNIYTVTWPVTSWVTGAAPSLTANDILVLWKEGTTLYGMYSGTVVQS